MIVHKELLAQSPLLVLPLVALALFLTVFLVECVRALVRPRAEVLRDASMPLTEDEPHE